METINVNGKEYVKGKPSSNPQVYFEGNWYEPKKEESKDWEILSFRNTEIIGKQVLIEKHNDGTGYAYKNGWDYNGEGSLTLQECLEQSNLEIYSVKRLSDGEVFTLGDNIRHTGGNHYDGKITSFNTDGKGMWANTSNNGNCQNSIHLIYKVEKLVLKYTTDGKPLYEGDSYWFIFSNKTVGRGVACANNVWSEKFYSTRELAEEYILFSQPLLSLFDLLNVWGDREPESYKNAPLFLEFKEFAHKKLNS